MIHSATEDETRPTAIWSNGKMIKHISDGSAVNPNNKPINRLQFRRLVSHVTCESHVCLVCLANLVSILGVHTSD